MVRATAAFIFVGAVAMYFMRRLHKPLRSLTDAAQQFGQGLEVHQLAEDGPAHVKSAIRAFNAMQQQVAEEVTKRANTLAAISHDVRTPLTALRVKAELIEDEAVRRDLISSVDRMEQVTASALDFLRGQSRGEPLRSVDLSALLESACLDLAEIGQPASFAGEHGVHHVCRPDAIARAVRNLIDNAIKYGGGARVTLQARAERVEIAVADNGPGIPFDQIALALEPFQRLPEARRSQQSGFGLGLTVAKAITEGHEGELVFAANTPTGLVATIRLPAKQI
jgi:signal transduction histidine kinase